MEWAEYPYANLADPQNTDTRVEILVRNPNEFPVRVNTDEVELRLLNAAGEIVYTNPNPTFYIWEGSWILEGETVANYRLCMLRDRRCGKASVGVP